MQTYFIFGDTKTGLQFLSADLDVMSEELKRKSRQLLSANLSKTKYFFNELKRYIDYLSTSSDSVAECQMKKQLAEKINALLATEESRLSEKRSNVSKPDSRVSSSSWELSAKTHTNNETESPPSSLHNSENSVKHWRLEQTRSELKYEKTVQKSVKRLETLDDHNKKRIEHIRNLKRELKSLERFERKICLERKCSTSSTSVENVPDSPTRKLTYVRGSVRTENESTTVTDILAESMNLADKPKEQEHKCIQVGKMGSEYSSTLSLIEDEHAR